MAENPAFLETLWNYRDELVLGIAGIGLMIVGQKLVNIDLEVLGLFTLMGAALGAGTHYWNSFRSLIK